MYIGYTYLSPLKRCSVHKANFKSGTLRCRSKILFSFGDTELTELASVKFENLKELRDMETQIIKQYGDITLNILGTKNSYSDEYKKTLYQKHNILNMSKKFYCETCKKEYRYSNKSNHLKTTKHIKNLE